MQKRLLPLTMTLLGGALLLQMCGPFEIAAQEMPTPDAMDAAAPAGPNAPIPKPPQGGAASPEMPMPQTMQPTPGAVPMLPPAGSTAEQQTAPEQPAQPAPSVSAPVPAAPAPAPAPAAPAAPARQTRTMTSSGGGSSFFFDDADVFEVIQTIFGDVLRVNYIIDPQVKGRVNFRTNTPIPRDKILPIMEIILRLNGVGVVEESGLYRIIPIGNIAKEPAPIRFGKDPNSVELKGTSLIQVVPLTFINSSEMLSVITPLLTQGGAVYDISKRNMLMIADTDANVRRLLQVIQMFDENTYKSASQPKIYVYPLQNSKADHVSKILQQVLLGQAVSSGSGIRSAGAGATTAPRSATPGQAPQPQAQPALPVSLQSSGDSIVSSGTKVYPDEVTNSLVIFASPGDYALILAAVKQLDTIPRQVMLEAMVAQVTLTDNLSFGVRWNLKTDLKLSPFDRDIKIGGPLGFQPSLDPLKKNSFGYTAFDSSGQVRLAIEALAEAGKAKLLSSPHILVADNREARIQVGTQIPIATSTTTTPTGTGTGTVNTTSSSIQYKDTGTILKVKPQVNDSGVVSLEITQEVSSASTQSVLGTEQFVIAKSEVTTNLIAQDGQTIVIGGLISESVSFTRSGIPILSSIPILGYLFGQTKDDTQRQELIILLTPRVVRNQKQADKVTSDYYELFKNLDKEMNIERLRKRLPSAEEGLQRPDPSPQSMNPEAQLPTAAAKKEPAAPAPTRQMQTPAKSPAVSTPAAQQPAKEQMRPAPAVPKQSPVQPAQPPAKEQTKPAQSSPQEPAATPVPAATPPQQNSPMMHDQGGKKHLAQSDALPVAYHARICSFKTEAPAATLRASVEKKLGGAHPVSLTKDGDYYAVRVHGFATVAALKETMQKLRIKDFKIGKADETAHAMLTQ